jgi:uncharacterized protein
MQNRLNMESFVFSLLQEKIPTSYTYHNIEHTVYVMEKVLEIGKNENCTSAELDLLKTAALWHDSGYVHVYENHEEEGCALAKTYLPDFGYAINDIEAICGMIMATKIPQQPKTKLEAILADADLEYLGTKTAHEKACQLFTELHNLHPQLTIKEWNKIQINFLQNHWYFTGFCKAVKEPIKNEYMNQLIEENKG